MQILQRSRSKVTARNSKRYNVSAQRLRVYGISMGSLR